jgi:hypothetical protein
LVQSLKGPPESGLHEPLSQKMKCYMNFIKRPPIESPACKHAKMTEATVLRAILPRATPDLPAPADTPDKELFTKEHS